MADKITAERRSKNMSRIRAKGMKPEIAVRRLAHALGYRFRLHRNDLQGKPDLVFSSQRKAIFVHGCFWHQHGDPACLDGRMPKSRLDYWEPKLRGNSDRDAAAISALESDGWRVLIVWECETRNLEKLSGRLNRFLDRAGQARCSP